MNKIPITVKSIITASNMQVSTEVNGEAVILNLGDGNYYGLDTIGMQIWQHIQQPIALEKIIEALVAEYDVTYETCQHDVVAVLQEMAERALVEIHNETPS